MPTASGGALNNMQGVLPAPSPKGKPGSLKDPSIAELFDSGDPEKRYIDLKEIGHGSFGAVYYAFDSTESESVAIKKMAFSGRTAADKWADIIKEVRFLRALRHQHVVQFRACYLKEQTCWLVMEYCIGSASDIVEVHKKPLKEVEIAAICFETLLGLRFLHSLNRIHRDVKAGNILLTDKGHIKLADFGSASLINPARSFVGTPYWISPEVILAMDEGHYDFKADIWSLGITCIELAERRPPLFNMNAMSALYHIAQNDSPGLAKLAAGQNGCAQDWSRDFRDFVDGCLVKEPAGRMDTDQSTQHPFVTSVDGRTQTVLLDLLARTQRQVRELDNFQYRKMRKLVYLDETGSGSSHHSSEVCSLDSEDVDDDTCGSSRSNSINSVRSAASQPQQQHGAGSALGLRVGASVRHAQHANGGAAGSSAQLDQLGQTPRPPAHMDAVSNNIYDSLDPDLAAAVRQSTDTVASSSSAPTNNTTVISVGESGAGASGNGASANVSPLADGRVEDQTVNGEERDRGNSQILDTKEAINTLRRSKFSTLRTTRIVAREQLEFEQASELAEQMTGYRRLRKAHQKQLAELEEKCRGEMELLKSRLDREYGNLTSGFEKELGKLRAQHQNEMDKRNKYNDDGERKLRKKIVQQQENDLKALHAHQKKEYKLAKERLKQETKMNAGRQSKKEVEQEYVRSKQSVQSEYQEAERRLANDQRHMLELEVRKNKRGQILSFHNLEQELLREDLNARCRQLETAHALLRRHHELTRDMEERQLAQSQTLRAEHLRAQHAAEEQNQREYTDRLTDELRRRHALQSRQQPREMKAKEAQIRKQFRAAVKTQTRQFKALQTQLLQTAPREEHRELVDRLKEEQKRKIAQLADQYESTIRHTVHSCAVKLEEWQEEEARAQSDKLTSEMELLLAFQSRQRKEMRDGHEKECERLNERVHLRKVVLEAKMDEEARALEKERASKLHQLKERQQSEMDTFDEQSVKMGFSMAALAGPSAYLSVESGSQQQGGAQGGAPAQWRHSQSVHSNASSSVPNSSGRVSSQNSLSGTNGTATPDTNQQRPYSVHCMPTAGQESTATANGR